jgi:hypothetical protein
MKQMGFDFLLMVDETTLGSNDEAGGEYFSPFNRCLVV